MVNKIINNTLCPISEVCFTVDVDLLNGLIKITQDVKQQQNFIQKGLTIGRFKKKYYLRDASHVGVMVEMKKHGI